MLLYFLAPLLLPFPAAASTALETEEIVVTASRYREGITSVPAQVTVITKEEIQASTASSIPDLLRSIAAVHVNDIAGNHRYYSVDLRGFGESAPLNTLVLVDGRRINQADLSGIDWTLIPLERVERIEILHGGGGAILYGDSATGGVIQIITRGAEADVADISAVYGSYDTFQGSAGAGGSWKDLSYSFSAHYLSSEGYRDNSDTEAFDLGVDLSYSPTDSALITLSGGLHRDDARLPGALKESELAGGIKKSETVNPDDFAEIDDSFIKGGAEVSFRGDSLFKVDLSFRRRDNSTFATFAGGHFTGNTSIDTLSVSPQLLFHHDMGGRKNSVTIGFDYHDDGEEIRNESLFFGEETRGDFSLEKKNYGLYIQDELEAAKGLFLSGGYRYDWADFSFGLDEGVSMDENLYMAGVNYVFRDKSYAYFSYSRSFRYPVLDEIFNFFTTSITAGLENQRTDNFELGLRHYFGESAYVHLNLFRTATKDEIFFNPVTYVNENLDGQARRKGVEVSFDAPLLSWLAVNGSATYQESRIDGGQFDGSELPNVPSRKAAVRAIVSPVENFTFFIEGVHVGKRPFVGDFQNSFGSQEDYSLLNCKLEFRREKLTAFLAVNNVTGREYSEYGVLGGFPLEKAFFPSPDRTFSVGASLHF